jgi:imidazole glycerol-phosphate synthase subunit HisH
VSLVTIIDYGSGNLHSAAKAFERAAREAGLDTRICVTADPDLVRQADRIVLPGVGAFADCRRGLDAVPGMVDAITEMAHAKARPFLGICVGMQLLASRGLEYTVTNGLGWIDGDVALIRPDDAALKIPHMGWNTLHPQDEHALLAGIPTGPNGLHAYFVHSYALTPAHPRDVVALAEYGAPITAMVARGNIVGTQFHPEKSQTLGLKLIGNFLRWTP